MPFGKDENLAGTYNGRETTNQKPAALRRIHINGKKKAPLLHEMLV